MTRLVVARCSFGHLSGWRVSPESAGERLLVCQDCGDELLVDVGRTEPEIRLVDTPEGRERWATERSRLARALLTRLVPEVEAYLVLQDMPVEDLPPQSPLRATLLAAREELRRLAP